MLVTGLAHHIMGQLDQGTGGLTFAFAADKFVVKGFVGFAFGLLVLDGFSPLGVICKLYYGCGSFIKFIIALDRHFSLFQKLHGGRLVLDIGSHGFGNLDKLFSVGLCHDNFFVDRAGCCGITRIGQDGNPPSNFFWGKLEAIWSLGEVVTLKDAEGEVLATYAVGP